MHNWSFDAAVIARYFDEKSKQMGVDSRDYIFENQPEITPQNLRGSPREICRRAQSGFAIRS